MGQSAFLSLTVSLFADIQRKGINFYRQNWHKQTHIMARNLSPPLPISPSPFPSPHFPLPAHEILCLEETEIQGGARNVIPLIVHVTHFYYYKNI